MPPAAFAGVAAWLDRGLRRGERGRLEAEYPASFRPERCDGQRVIWSGGRPVAHAMLHECTIQARGQELPVAMIGLVYTEPAFRRRGMARACIEACLDEARRRGLALALLWSERHDFYARLGFLPAGRETLLGLDLATRRAWPDCADLATRPPEPGDGVALEALYAAKPVRARRESGDLARHFAAPGVAARVAVRAGRPVAYAALGRGDDFAGVVHEWAGAPDGVKACVRSLGAELPHLFVLAGPEPEPAAAALLSAGAHRSPGCFALARVLDARELLARLLPADAGFAMAESAASVPWRLGDRELRLESADLLALLFGAPAASTAVAARLGPAAAARLAGPLPWPLYVWGFDSV